MSRAQAVMTNLLACADIRINGARPWDIHVHDQRFFSRVLASGTLGFGESYMDGWWECDALDEMCCRAIRARLPLRATFVSRVGRGNPAPRLWQSHRAIR